MPEQNPPDLDPELLRESGRASAIQDLADQAKHMGDRAVALERANQKALQTQVSRWRRTTAYLAVAVAILGVMAIFQLVIASENREILDDVDKLVTFVEEVEADDSPDNSAQLQSVFEAVFQIRDVVCASSDPQMREACSQLTESAGN